MNKKKSINLRRAMSFVLMFLIIGLNSSFVSVALADMPEQTLTIGSQSAKYNDVITVPVTASITNIQGMQFSINYSGSKLEYVDCLSTNIDCLTDVATSTNKINITWYNVSNFLTLNGENLLSLRFRVISPDVTTDVLSITPVEIINSADTDVTGNVIYNSGTITLNPVATLSGISITNPATKLTYTVGDALDISGLVVTGTYDDTSTKIETITVDNISGFNSSSPVTGQVLTITVGGKTTTYTIDVVAPLSSSKAITSFNFTTPATGLISETDHTIAITVPFGTDVTTLTPIITVSAVASVSPLSNVVNDFTTPATYTVTAEDGSTQAYIVVVTVATDSDKDITHFILPDVGEGVITGTDIAVTVPFGTDITGLVPTIVLSGGTVSPLSGVAQDFTSPVTYTVTAGDSSTKDYIVTVTISPDPVVTAFNTVSDTLTSNSVANNLDTVNSSNFKSFSGLFFEKRTNIADATTAIGRITFNSALDLSNDETKTFLQNIGTKMDANTIGTIGLDFTGATDSLTLKGTSATIKFYGLNALGFDGESTATEINSKLIAFDDSGNPLDKSLLIPGIGTYLGACEVGGGCYVFTIDVNHFTKYKIDNTAPIITLVGSANTDLYVGDVYTEQGATWSDNIDGSGNVTDISGDVVDTSIVGTYIVKYNKTDIAGNKADEKTRTVNISIRLNSGVVAPTPTSCFSVDYDEWQTTCVNNSQYRNIKALNPSGCAMTQAQREAAQRTCVVAGTKEETSTITENKSINEPQALGIKIWPSNSLIRGTDMRVWLVKNGKRFHIINLKELQKYRGRVINNISDDAVAKYSILPKL